MITKNDSRTVIKLSSFLRGIKIDLQKRHCPLRYHLSTYVIQLVLTFARLKIVVSLKKYAIFSVHFNVQRL